MANGRGALLLAALGAGCSAHEGTVSFTVADSAGVTIVTSGAPSIAAGQWFVSEQPDLAVPSVGEGYELFRVSGVHMLSHDRLVLANRGSGELLLFRMDGSLLRTIGRPGEGPGEFSALQTVIVTQDETLVAADLPRQTLIHFDTAGTVVNTVRTDHGGGIRYAFVKDLLAGGRFLGTLGQQVVIPGSVPGLVDLPFEMLIIDSGGGTTGPVQLGVTAYLLYEDEGRLRSIAPPLRQALHLATWRDRVFGAKTSDMGVREYTAGGTLSRHLRRDSVAAPLSESEWNDVVARELSRANPASLPARRRALRGIPRPEAWSSSSGLVIDRVGHAWVRHYSPSEGAEESVECLRHRIRGVGDGRQNPRWARDSRYPRRSHLGGSPVRGRRGKRSGVCTRPLDSLGCHEEPELGGSASIRVLIHAPRPGGKEVAGSGGTTPNRCGADGNPASSF